MATPIGTILCVGMLGLGSVLLVGMAIVSAFIVIPVEDKAEAVARFHHGRPLNRGERQYTTAM